jgi:alkylated DNA repair dioxygenase AlkB
MSKRPAIDWQTLPLLLKLRDQITKLTGQCANFCVIQYYPNGRIIIPPHRDLEVTQGTSICGLSLGSLRTLNLDPPQWWTQSSNLEIKPEFESWKPLCP